MVYPDAIEAGAFLLLTGGEDSDPSVFRAGIDADLGARYGGLGYSAIFKSDYQRRVSMNYSSTRSEESSGPCWMAGLQWLAVAIEHEYYWSRKAPLSRCLRTEVTLP